MDNLVSKLKHEKLTGVKLSSCEVVACGAYGRIFKVEYNGSVFAGKELNSMYVEGNVKQVKNDFLRECVQHSKLDHPNIVKMIGVYYPSEQAVLPVLVMELMDCSLTSLLEKSQNLPVYFKLFVLQDISKGLRYLHTLNPPVIHRNLTCDNILLTKHRVAKISDFVAAKEAPFVKSVLVAPGTVGFMPPEALKGCYGLAYDLFSFGCIVCHVGSQQWPKPTPQTDKKESEVERRQYYIDQFSTEPLKQLAMRCLSDDPERRPTISQVCEEITSMITECHYKNSSIKMNYLHILKEQQVETRDLHLLLVGVKNAGKTSLVSSLANEQFVDGASKKNSMVAVQKVSCKNWKRIDKGSDLHDQFIDQVTQQIRLEVVNSFDHFVSKSTAPSCTLNIPSQAQDDLCATIWDFEDEALLHNIPSVFISEYTVPVITFDASKELTDEIVPDEGSYQPPECHNSISGIHYWLKVVDSVCSVEREDGHLQPTVVLAGTHIDKLHPDLEVARNIATEKILPQLEKELFGKCYARHLAGYKNGLKNALKQCCFFISNKHRDKELERLKSTATEAAGSLKKDQSIFVLNIEAELLKCKEHVITKSNMLDLVTNCAIPMAENSSEFEGLLKYLHDKGTILYFGQAKSLQNFVILSPWWFPKLLSYTISAYYYIVREESCFAKYGLLHESLLQRLEAFHLDYPSAIRVTEKQVKGILHLLGCSTTWFSEEGYSLFPNHSDAVIVPFHVPHDDSKNPPNTSQQRILYFKFDDGFVPVGLVNKLIAKCICRNRSKLLWMRYGKVGLHLGAHQVYYISQCEEKGSIQLTITMPETDDLTSAQERRELIDDITGLLDGILKELTPKARKRPIRFVPCLHCLALHITLSEISSGNSIFCATTNDSRLPHNYYDDLLDPAFLTAPQSLVDPHRQQLDYESTQNPHRVYTAYKSFPENRYFMTQVTTEEGTTTKLDEQCETSRGSLDDLTRYKETTRQELKQQQTSLQQQWEKQQSIDNTVNQRIQQYQQPGTNVKSLHTHEKYNTMTQRSIDTSVKGTTKLQNQASLGAQRYPMNRHPHGIAVIINNTNFFADNSTNLLLSNRSGSEVDEQNLHATWSYLCYSVKILRNLTASELLRELMQISLASHENFDSFVCCILSHGYLDGVYGTDSQPVKMRDIAGLFTGTFCPSLANKPKLFFIQACRGDEEDVGYSLQSDDKDSTEDKFRHSLPCEADFLYGYATPPGNISWRSPQYGSWYISKLCEVLVDFAPQEDLLSILTIVNERVSEAYTTQGYKQCPAPVSLLRRQVWFFDNTSM